MSARDSHIICRDFISVEKLIIRMVIIALTGLMPWVRVFITKIMITKYNFEFSEEEVSKEITRLTNQLWKLIPMRENHEDWDKQLETVIIDIAGKDEIFVHNSHFL